MQSRKEIFNKPFYLFLLTIYPSLSLLALNIREVDPSVVARPLLVSLFLAFIFLLLNQLFTKNRRHAYIQTAFLLVLFFNYGHLIIFIREIERVKQIGNWIHIPILTASLFVYLLVRWKRELLHDQTIAINIISLILVIFPLVQISQYTLSTQFNATPISIDSRINLQTNTLPDIYYIIPDQYIRADTLLQIGYDNSQFLDSLREIGFFVADCSISNYRRTALSLASSLNMDYLFNAIPNKGPKDDNAQAVYNALINNRVTNELKQLGYKTIAFQSGYRWGEWRDADIFFKPDNNLLLVKYLTPFENLFLESTILKIAKDLKWLPFLSNTYMKFGEHYKRVHFVLDTLPEVADLPGPKFVYAHIIIPHNPYVFLPDGSFNQEANTLSWTDTEGYIKNLRFLNSALAPIVSQIIQKSESPPIIIIQADHGTAFFKNDRYYILNAYYLPGKNIEDIPSTISPVNTFRLIFNQYFGTDFPYREDVGFHNDIGHPFKEKLFQFTEDYSQCPSPSP